MLCLSANIQNTKYLFDINFVKYFPLLILYILFVVTRAFITGNSVTG